MHGCQEKGFAGDHVRMTRAMILQCHLCDFFFVKERPRWSPLRVSLAGTFRIGNGLAASREVDSLSLSLSLSVDGRRFCEPRPGRLVLASP